MTGSSANELVGYLETKGLKVNIITMGAVYAGGGLDTGEIHGSVCTLKGLYNGKNKILRLIFSLLEGWLLARKAFSLPVSVVVCLTDPPLLNFWVARASLSKSIPWIYWSMDLYPDAFVSNGLISRKNFFYRTVIRCLRRNPPSGLISLGSNQAKYLNDIFSSIAYNIILPSGIHKMRENLDTPNWKDNDNRIVLGYVGNLGEAHNENLVISAINSIDPTRHKLILSVYGAKAKKILNYARGREGVAVFSAISQADFSQIDLHLVSLLPEWDNVCVPSKAFSAVSVEACLILNCSFESDIWLMLKDASWHLPVDLKIEENFRELLNSITLEEIDKKKQKSKVISNRMQEIKSKAFAEVHSMISSFCQK